MSMDTMNPNRDRQKMRDRKKSIITLTLAALFIMASTAQAVQVQDLIRLKGAESNKLVGMGIVIGLKGTGDGGKFAPSVRSLASTVQNLIDPTVIAAELKDAKNVALVAISVNLPASGVREGDKVDVHVSAVAAKSLEGGRLFLVPLIGPMKNSPVFAFAEGSVIIEDKDVPTVGMIRNGAQLTRDIFVQYLDEGGRITLVLNESVATLPMATNLANLINGYLAPDGPNIARVIDQKNVVVDVPVHERREPAAFISSVLQTYVDPSMISTGARVVINEKTGTIVFSHDVQISPVGVTHRGMTINMITPEPVATDEAPRVEQVNTVGIDPENRGGAKLADLIKAFNQLKVEAADRIAIIKEIHRSGRLHAQLIIE